jgi:cytochrome c2
MKKSPLHLLLVLVVICTSSVFASEVIEDAMKKYHKAPKGQDPVCKIVANGKASTEQIAELLTAYQAMCKEAPPRGEKADWVKKCQAVIASLKKIQGGDTAGAEEFKKASNCKACHSEHKPE